MAVNNLLSKESESTIFDSIAKIITGKSTRYSLCIIRVYNEKNKQLIIIGSAGGSKKDQKISIKYGEGVVWKTFISGLRKSVFDLQKEPLLHDLEEGHSFKSMICIPLQNIRRTMNVGTLSIYTDFNYFFDEIDIESLNNFSNQISHVLKNVQEIKELELINRISDAINRETEIEEIFRIAVAEIPWLIGFDGCSIVKINKYLNTGEIITSSVKRSVGLTFPLTNFINQQMREQPEVLSIPDVQLDNRLDNVRSLVIYLRSMVIIPIYSKSDHLYGAIVLFTFVERMKKHMVGRITKQISLTLGYVISDLNKDFYLTVANQLAVAIDKDELIRFKHNEFDRRASIQKIVSNISEEDENLKDNLDAVLEKTFRITKAEIGFIALFSNKTKFIISTSTYGISEDNIPELDIEGDGLVGWVCKYRMPYSWPGGEIDHKYIPYLNFPKKIRSEFIVPLVYGSEVIGIIQVGSSKKNAFRIADEYFLLSLADELAIIIQNRKAFRAAIKLSEVRFDEMNIETICEVLAKKTCEIMESPVTCVWLKEFEKNEEILELKAWEGISLNDVSNFTMPRSDGGISWNTIDKAEEQVKPNLDSDQDEYISYYSLIDNINDPKNDFEHPVFAIDNGLQSMISMPLIVQKEVLGTINTYGRRQHGFSDKEIHLFKNLVISGSIALKNAQLIEHAKKINEKLLGSAQIANTGMVALSFSHDASHTLHYINALLSSLVELLPKSKRDSEKGREVISSLTSYTERLSHLYGSLIRYSKSKDTNYRQVELKEIIEDVIDLYEIRFSSNKIKIYLKFERKQFENVRIECDKIQIEQVFINLFNNAIHAIRQKRPREPRIKITVRDLNGEYAEILFKDNGTGIFEENLDKIFEPLFTTKGIEGSGFGLAICRRIIEDNHLGTISVQSKVGQFTIVKIKLSKRIF